MLIFCFSCGIQLALFERLAEEKLPADSSDVLGAILGACKLLDLLLVNQSDDFQM